MTAAADPEPVAASSRATRDVLHFGPYRLDVAGARLICGDRLVALRPKAFELLAALVRVPGELVTKEELLDRVWGRRFITEGVVKSIVGEVRDALDDDPKRPRWIETVPKRGYRFIGRVASSSGSTAAAPPRAGASPADPPPIGRDEALRRLAALHDAHRLLTIVGPAGVGKTRLAVALATARGTGAGDGTWFVELASLPADTTDAAAVCARVAQSMRLDASAGRAAESLAQALRPLDALLVLDNVEHLLEPVASVVAALLAGAPRLRIVVTSQEALRLGDEQVYRVAPLDLPEVGDDADPDRLMESGAVRLFVQRVSERLPGFTLAPQQQHAVAAICRALDGVPLALELAAARVPVLGVHGIADLLLGDDHDAPLRLLTGGARTAAPRQRTLRNAIEWSYRLLDEEQQRVFRRLGVFGGGFALQAAQDVCGDDALDRWRVLDAVHALVDKSLVEVAMTDDAPRFRLFGSLRAYAVERLVEAGEESATRDRHLRSTVARWQRADEDALVEPAQAWIERRMVDVDDLRAAFVRADRTADDDALLALVAATSLFWARAGLGREAWRWVERARAAAASSTDPARRRGFDLAIATLGLYAGIDRPELALAAAERATDAHEAADDAPRAYFAAYLVVQLGVRAGLSVDREPLLARMARLERSTWGDVLKRFLRNARGYELRLAGDRAGYRDHCRTEQALCRSLGAVAEGWVASQGLMLAEADLGRTDEAIAVADDAIDDIRRAGRLRQHPVFLALRATLLAESGETGRARAALAEALPVLEGSGHPWMAHVAFAWLAAHEGRDDDAARVLGRHAAALADGSATGSGAYVARALEVLRTRLAKRLGRDVRARLHAEGERLDEAAIVRLAIGA